MAKRRMFSLDVVDTDSFLDLPASSQSLYFHLGMRADDDGFVSSPKRITAMVGAAGDDLKLLIAKGFVIPFESGVCVIRDWRVNNYIQRDRYTPSIYTEEKQRLSIAENGRYSHVDTQCIQDVSKSDTQVRIDKEREEIDNKAATPPRARFIPPRPDSRTEHLQRPQRPEEGHAAACQHRAQRTSWTAGRCSWRWPCSAWYRQRRYGVHYLGGDRPCAEILRRQCGRFQSQKGNVRLYRHARINKDPNAQPSGGGAELRRQCACV